jgi:hypothetical protein
MNEEERRWGSRLQKQALILTCSCLAAASCSWESHVPFHSAQPVEQLGAWSCYSVSSSGCCVSSSVESARRIVRIALCSREIGRHAVSLQCVFEYVLSDVRDGEKPYRTAGTCMVEGDPVGRPLRADHQSLGASLRRPPYFSVLLLPVLAGSLQVFAWRSRVLSRWRSGAADSADLKNLLQKMRVACDCRRSEGRQPRCKFYRRRRNLHETASCVKTILRLNCCCNIKVLTGVAGIALGVYCIGDEGCVGGRWRLWGAVYRVSKL